MKESVSKFLVWVLLIIAIPAGLYFGKTFLAPLAIGVVLSMMLIPIMDWLMSKGFSKGWAVAGSTVTLLMFLVFLGLLITIQVKMISRDWAQIEKQSVQYLEHAQKFIEAKSGLDPDEQLAQAKTMLSKLGTGSPAAIGSVGGAIANVILIIVYVVLVLSQRARFKEFILLNFPKQDHIRVRKALKEIRKTSGGYFYGMLKAMIILAILYGTGFMIGGVKYAFLLALIAAVFSFIPYVGNAIGGSLAAMLALVSGGPSSVLVVVIVMFATQMIDNYITQPYVVGKEVDLNPFMTITSVVAFGVLWGIAGAVIAIPITGIIRVTFQYLPNTKSLAFLMGNEKPVMDLERVKEQVDERNSA
ncbi:AI-2E family transporter [Dyadobacter psychrophilus]|uniref:Predicted PurR-regulated permease PerM n=1 Tax=Dyadobacter psychrophilus TaxID=651661 RepID=A0A1T5ENB1_9BACT|nr:AI-2E family transporter [Dyadobacter psychrophilus]SKB85417.1 Predicted PurR-regulated permease PerM [Dyadobacter psychrophilus]